MVKKFITVLALLGVLLSLQVSFVAAQEAEPEPTIHVVQKGDTLESIADYYGISVDDLLAANEGLDGEAELEIGTELVIPTAEQETVGEQPEGETPDGGEVEKPEVEKPEGETPAGGEVEQPEVEKPEGETPAGGEVEQPEGETPAAGEENQEGKEPTDVQEPEGEEPPDGEEKQQDEELASEEPTEGKQAEDPAAEEAPALRDGSSGLEAEAADDIGVQGSFNPGTGVSKIAVMNVDPGGPVGYSVLFYGQNGVDDTTTLASQGPLNYRGVNYYDLSTLSLAFGSGWIGSAQIEADREVFAVVDQSYSGGTYTGGDGLNGEAYESVVPATDIYLPYATQAGTGDVNKDRFSRVTIQGTKASGTTNLTISYRDQNGNDVAACNPGNTSRTVEGTRAISFEPVFRCAAAGQVFNGSMRVVADAPVVVTFDGSWALGWKTSYNAVDAATASNKLYFPSIFRRLPRGPWDQWSNMFVGNTSGSEVTARVSWYKIGETSPTLQWNMTLPPNSAKEINTRVGGTGFTDPTPQQIAALGTNFNGGAVVEKLSGPDNALVGVAHNFWGNAFFGGSTYAALTEGQAGSMVYAPFAYRLQSGGDWKQWSKVTVMNITGSSVPVEVKFYKPDGSLQYDLTAATGTFNVANGSVVAVNTLVGCDLGLCSAGLLNNLGTNFTGSVVVSSPNPGARLAGVMNVLYPTRLNTFNAVAK